jgi:hypothetical protein
MLSLRHAGNMAQFAAKSFNGPCYFHAEHRTGRITGWGAVTRELNANAGVHHD